MTGRKKTAKAAAKPPRTRPSGARGKAKPASRPKGTTASGGDAAVRAYIAGLPTRQREIAKRFDALVARDVATVLRVIKWGLPFYGVPGNGWFVSFGGIGDAVRITFFQGTSLDPSPPIGDKKQLRAIELRTLDEFEAAPIASWIRQAATLPGFGA